MPVKPICVYRGQELASYGFGQGHPFGPDRHDAFWQLFEQRGLAAGVRVHAPKQAMRGDLALFHSPQYIDRVVTASAYGGGFLDMGDTPAFPGVYEAAAYVVGTTLDAVHRVVNGECRRAFTPIAGLHHARPDTAAGFCVFNDCAIAIAALREKYGIQRIAYVDIDAHHGDGVFYAFEEDPDVCLVDFHEDGHFQYPGTGFAHEQGKGVAKGTKLNWPMPANADDAQFMAAWQQAESFLDAARPEFILLQCGADSLAGDPLTHLGYTAATHGHASARLCALADRHAEGRLLALGGGGYNRQNLAEAWCAVVAAMLAHTE